MFFLINICCNSRKFAEAKQRKGMSKTGFWDALRQELMGKTEKANALCTQNNRK